MVVLRYGKFFKIAFLAQTEKKNRRVFSFQGGLSEYITRSSSDSKGKTDILGESAFLNQFQGTNF